MNVYVGFLVGALAHHRHIVQLLHSANIAHTLAEYPLVNADFRECPSNLAELKVPCGVTLKTNKRCVYTQCTCTRQRKRGPTKSQKLHRVPLMSVFFACSLIVAVVV